MNDKTELLPCPFCGGTHALTVDNLAGDDWYVECGACKVQQHAIYPRSDAAIAAWNRRAASPSSKSTKEAPGLRRYYINAENGHVVETARGPWVRYVDLQCWLASSSIKEDGWKDAVLDKLAITCMDAPIGTPPADILDQIIRWHVDVALDPAVSARVHYAHCFKGEHAESCKYGDDDCPAAPSIKEDGERAEPAPRFHPAQDAYGEWKDKP